MHFHFIKCDIMKVLKFGGTSVGTPERIRGVKKIIESQSSPCLIVVSAFQGITDDLKHLSELASVRDDEYENLLDKIIAKHIELKNWYTRIGFSEGESKEFPHLPFCVTFMSYAIEEYAIDEGQIIENKNKITEK